MFYTESLHSIWQQSIKATTFIYFQTVSGRVTTQNSATFYVKVACFLHANHRFVLCLTQSCRASRDEKDDKQKTLYGFYRYIKKNQTARR